MVFCRYSPTLAPKASVCRTVFPGIARDLLSKSGRCGAVQVNNLLLIEDRLTFKERLVAMTIITHML